MLFRSDNENSWVTDGRAATILDNLIAENKAVPMYVVMTNGLTDGSWAGGSTPEGIATLEKELLEDVIPLVERRYRVHTDKLLAYGGITPTRRKAIPVHSPISIPKK